MIRLLAGGIVMAIVALALYLPAAVPPERFLEQIRIEHALNLSAWGSRHAIDVLDRALAALWRRHAGTLPDLIFYLAGADPHEGDRLGRLKITSEGLTERDRRVLTAARERRIPVAISMAGGYGRVIEDTVAVQINTLREAMESWRQWNNMPHERTSPSRRP